MNIHKHKAVLFLSALSSFVLGANNAKAMDIFQLNALILAQSIDQASAPLNLIDWKVGDTASFNIKMAFGSGTMKKYVAKDEGEALWVNQDINLMGQKQLVEVLLRKSDGKILKMRQNGKDQEIPDNSDLVVDEQEYTEVSVPAGKFECIHLTAHTKDIKKIEIWANPKATVMEGMLKQIMATQFGDMTLELTQFKKI